MHFGVSPNWRDSVLNNNNNSFLLERVKVNNRNVVHDLNSNSRDPKFRLLKKSSHVFQTTRDNTGIGRVAPHRLPFVERVTRRSIDVFFTFGYLIIILKPNILLFFSLVVLSLLPSLTVFDFVSSTTMCHLILSHHPSHQLIAVFSFFQKVVTKNSHTHEEKSHFKVSHVPYIFELFPRNPISYIRFRGRKEIRYA